MNSNMEWQQLDEDLNMILEAALAGTVEQKIETMTAVTYNMARKWFGTKERNTIAEGRQLNQRERDTKLEERDQDPLQAVEEHRRRCP